MYKQIRHIENHIYDTLKVSSKDKQTFISSIFIEGYKVTGSKKYVIASILGHNNPLNGCKIEVDIDDIIEYLYYDDGEELNYYGDYSSIEDMMYPQIEEEIDDKFIEWSNLKDKEAI